MPTLGLPVHTFDPHSPRSLCAPLAIFWLLLFLLRYSARASAEESRISPCSLPPPPLPPPLTQDQGRRRFVTTLRGSFPCLTFTLSYKTLVYTGYHVQWCLRGGLYFTFTLLLLLFFLFKHEVPSRTDVRTSRDPCYLCPQIIHFIARKWWITNNLCSGKNSVLKSHHFHRFLVQWVLDSLATAVWRIMLQLFTKRAKQYSNVMAQKLTFASGCKYIAYQQAAFFVCDCKNAYLLCHVSPLNLEDQILLQIWQLIKKIMYAFMEFISCGLSNIVLFVWVLFIIFVASYWLLLTLTHVQVILLIYLTGASSRPVKNFLIHLAATICAGVTAGSLTQGLPAMNK